MSFLCRRTFLPLLVVLLLARPHVSAANPMETYGYGSRAISMGGAYSAVSDDFAAVYYNPAGLSQIGDVDLGFGMTFLNSSFNSIQNVVVGEAPGGDPLIGDVETNLSDNGGLMGGVAIGLSEDIALGVGVYLPSTHYLARLQTQDQREPGFIWYEKRPKRFSLLASVGARVYKGLHIGAGIDILFGPKGQVDVFVPVGGEGTLNLALMFRPRISPYAGLLYKMKNGMSIGIVYKEKKEQGEVDINLNAYILAGESVTAVLGKMDSMIFYSPRQATLGWAWQRGERFLVSLDLAWLQWSKFDDATMLMSVRIGPNETEVPLQQRLHPGFSDTRPAEGRDRIPGQEVESLFPGRPGRAQIEGGILFPKIPGSGTDRGYELPGQRLPCVLHRIWVRPPGPFRNDPGVEVGRAFPVSPSDGSRAQEGFGKGGPGWQWDPRDRGDRLPRLCDRRGYLCSRLYVGDEFLTEMPCCSNESFTRRRIFR